MAFTIVLVSSLTNYANAYHNTALKFADGINRIATKYGVIYVKTFRSSVVQDSVNLVIVLHGDAPFNKPGYQYRMAELIAKQNNNTIAVGILRPGYTDPQNNTSDGTKGLTTGDNYTKEVIETIAEVIQTLKVQYRALNTILVGHSGGSAITGGIIGLKPGLVHKAVLVSCPCNVPQWRSYMGTKYPDNSAWSAKVESISPLSVAKTIDKRTEVVVVIGEKDDVTPLHLSKEYFEELRSKNYTIRFVSVPNEGHEILLHATTLQQIQNLIR